MTPRPPTASGRLDVLDGLRGLAILIVLVFHLFTWPAGGFLGVDLFFVLSGFLITNRLLRDSASFGSAQLKDFYYGRILRIVPALAEMIVLYGAIKLLYPANVTLFRQNILSTVFLVSNWTRAFQLPYPDYLGHMWSLSIEEQYYLLWPLIVFAALAAAGERLLGRVAGALILALWSVRIILALNPVVTPDRLYNGTDTRISSILVGCFVAVLLRNPAFTESLKRNSRSAAVAFGLAIACSIAAMSTFDWRDRSLFYWGLSLFSSASGVIAVFLVTFPKSVPARVLSSRPLVWIGKRSYGLYLFHFPIFLWLLSIRKIPTGWKMAALCALPTFLLAALSWRYVEEPCMRLRYRNTRPSSAFRPEPTAPPNRIAPV